MKNNFLNEQSSKKLSTFIIAEAGSNWKVGTFEEDVKCAKKLIDVASDSGADAVKFQTYKAETTYVKNAGKSDYLQNQDVNDEIEKIFEHLSMPYEIIPILSEYCKKKNVLFMSTPFSVNDAKEIDPYVDIHKIASFEINHLRLIEYILSTKKPVIISTGASTYDDIDFVMNYFKKNNSDVSLLQCTSNYPASFESLNLSAIPKLKQKYSVPIGLSDHSVDPFIAPLVAIGYGASIIEKHFTLDKKSSGPDHFFALEPNELKQMVHLIRNAEKSRGHGEKIILDEEKELWKFAKRTLQAIKPISKGDELKEGYNFDVLRPGKRSRGLDAKFLELVQGKHAKSDIALGEGITEYE